MDSPGLDLSLAFLQKVSVLLAFGVRWPEELVEVSRGGGDEGLESVC